MLLITILYNFKHFQLTIKMIQLKIKQQMIVKQYLITLRNQWLPLLQGITSIYLYDSK